MQTGKQQTHRGPAADQKTMVKSEDHDELETHQVRKPVELALARNSDGCRRSSGAQASFDEAAHPTALNMLSIGPESRFGWTPQNLNLASPTEF